MEDDRGELMDVKGGFGGSRAASAGDVLRSSSVTANSNSCNTADLLSPIFLLSFLSSYILLCYL